jgi:hypothetical protein
MQTNMFLIRPTCACKHLFTEQYKRSFHPAEKKSQHNSCIANTKNLKGCICYGDCI